VLLRPRSNQSRVTPLRPWYAWAYRLGTHGRSGSSRTAARSPWTARATRCGPTTAELAPPSPHSICAARRRLRHGLPGRKRTLLRTRTYGREMAAWLAAVAGPGPGPPDLRGGWAGG